MKKVLFATTALVASAGIASAELSISGSAEMGIFGGDDIDTQFFNDFTLSVDGSGETDGGLSFGMHVEIEESNGEGAVNGSASYDNESVFISGDFGTLTLGEIDGAFDKVLQEVNLAAGSIADDETIHAGFNGNGGFDGIYDNQILRYDYSFGAFSLALSLEQDMNGADGDDTWQVGFKYETDVSGVEMAFALGYASADFDADDSNEDIIGLSIYGDFGNGFEAAFNYTDAEDGGEHIGIGVGYTVDAWSFGLNYGEYDFDGGGDSEGFGLAVNYDLGGGAVAQFGYGYSDVDGFGDTDTFSLGIAMSF